MKACALHFMYFCGHQHFLQDAPNLIQGYTKVSVEHLMTIVSHVTYGCNLEKRIKEK